MYLLFASKDKNILIINIINLALFIKKATLVRRK